MGIRKVFIFAVAWFLLPCHGAFAAGAVTGSSEKVSVAKVSLSKAPLLKMTAGDIKRHVTAKASLFRILRSATASGVNAKDLMAAILSTSASPADVIYIATVEGYPVDLIAQEAIIAGVSAEVVFKSAIAAGADRGDVARAMVALGASPVDVADVAAKVALTKDTLP